jgi:hypothetical protein
MTNEEIAALQEAVFTYPWAKHAGVFGLTAKDG